MQTQVLSTSSIRGHAVRNLEGRKLGEIEDLVIDLASGTVAYAVLSFGGVLGVGEKLFAVPWNAMGLDLEERCFVLDVDKEFLENAPGFDKNHWPDFASPLFRERHYTYYEIKIAAR